MAPLILKVETHQALQPVQLVAAAGVPAGMVAPETTPEQMVLLSLALLVVAVAVVQV